MEKIRLVGESEMGTGGYYGGSNYDRNFTTRCIQLTPDELKAQLKPTRELTVGSKVWMEGEVSRLLPDNKVGVNIKENCHHWINVSEIITAFPAEQEKEKAELPKKINPYEFPPYSKPIVEMIEAINQLNAVVKEIREKK